MVDKLIKWIPYNEFIGDLECADKHLVELIEEWRDIKDYEPFYQISTFGRLFSKRLNRVLRPGITKCGYHSVVLCGKNKKKSFLLHRIIADNFLLTPKKKMDVNHKDGVKTNNSLLNIEWMTRSENILHSFKNGLSKTNLPKYQSGPQHINSKPILKLDKNTGAVIKAYLAISEAVKDGYKSSTLSMCLTGKNKTAYGYKWIYKLTQ